MNRAPISEGSLHARGRGHGIDLTPRRAGEKGSGPITYDVKDGFGPHPYDVAEGRRPYDVAPKD